MWCWRRPESPLDSKEIKSVNPKGNQPWIFTGRTEAVAETPILWPPDAKNWLFGGEAGNRGWDSLMAPPTQWTWVWVNSGRWWRTEKPGVLQSMGSQSWTRLNDWTTKTFKTIRGSFYKLGLVIHGEFYWPTYSFFFSGDKIFHRSFTKKHSQLKPNIKERWIHRLYVYNLVKYHQHEISHVIIQTESFPSALNPAYSLPNSSSLSEFYLFLNFFWLCEVACGILVPWPETEPSRSAMAVQSLSHFMQFIQVVASSHSSFIFTAEYHSTGWIQQVPCVKMSSERAFVSPICS